MHPVCVIAADIVIDGLNGFLTRFEASPIDQLFLQCRVERLHAGIVVWIPLMAHTDLHLVLLHQGNILFGAVLGTPVRVVNQALTRLTFANRQLERLQRESFFHVGIHMPANHFP